MASPHSEATASHTVSAKRRNLLREHTGIVIIVILYLILGIAYSLVTPVFEASDELWHYPFVRHLANGGSLPVQSPDQLGPWRQEGSQPPLYYALGALVTFWIDTDDIESVRQINPHADMGIPKPDRNANMVIHPSGGEALTGTVLAVHVVRWLSVLMGAVTVIACYGSAYTVFAGDRVVALAASAITAFNPMFLFITGSVNNDALVIMLCALVVWVVTIDVARKPSVWQWVLLGVLMGLASLSKASALGLGALVAILIVYRAWRERSWRDLIVSGLLVGVPLILIGGWWYVRNWRLYGDPVGLNAFVAIVGGRYPKPTLIQLLGEWKGFVMSYWGFFGGVNVPAPDWVYWVLSAIGLAGLLAAPIYVWRRSHASRLSLTEWVQMAMVAVWPLVVLVSLVRWTLMTIASQGRLMFSALTCLSILMAMGLAAIVSGRRRAILPALAGAIMLVIAAILPAHTIAPAYAAPDILDSSDVAGLSPRCDATFGESIRLLAYDVEAGTALPGDDLAVTFYWECLQPISDDYSVFVHLLDANDVIIAQRDMYPGQGNYPTSLWQVGDIFADTYVVSIPEVVLTPADAQFEVGFYRLGDAGRLPVVDGTGRSVGDHLRFGAVTIPRVQEDGIPNPVTIQLEKGIQLIGYDLDRTAALPGETLHLVLHWRAQKDVDADYSVFTHVLGDENRIWAQMDGWPLQGNAPTSSWQSGQTIVDPYELTIAEDTPPGLYELEIGMYDAEGRRLSVLGQGGFVQGNRIVLGAVRVMPTTQPSD